MLTRTTPLAPIVVDATAQDTGHRTRGIGRYARSLWRAMSALDEDVVALRLTDARRSWRATLPDRHLLRFMKAQSGLGRELERAGCTVFGATEPWVLPRGTGRLRVVPTCHDLIPFEFSGDYQGWDHAKWTVYFRWLRSTRALERCPCVISPSEATRAALVRHLGLAPDHVVVIPHGLDHERFYPPLPEEVEAVRGRLGIGAEPYALYLGGFDYRKNVDRLVEAFAHSGRSDDMLLLLAGPSSREERRRVLDTAQRCGVMRRVIWAGRVEEGELNGLYGGAQVFLYPSLSEGFGLQVLEAMACGCPVITSDRSALPEVAGDAALLVDPTSTASIAAAIAALDDEQCERLSQAGIARAREFDWATTARRTLDVYQRVA